MAEAKEKDMVGTPVCQKRITDEQAEQDIRRFIARQKRESFQDQSAAARSDGDTELSATSLAVLGDAVKALLWEAPNSVVPAYGVVIEHILECMKLSDEEREQSHAWIIAEVSECVKKPTSAKTFVDFLRIVTLRALLQLIRKRAEGYFYNQGARNGEIKDLGTQIVVKILRMFEAGKAPNTNAGAFFARICQRAWIDHYRKETRRREFLGEEEDVGARAISNDGPAARAILNCFIEELPPTQRTIVEMRLDGAAWPEIAAHLGMSVTQARNIAYAIEWPGGSSSPRNRRRSA